MRTSRKKEQSKSTEQSVEQRDNAAQNRETGKKRNRRLKTVVSTQTFCPVLDVKDGIVLTRQGEYVKLMEIAPINFDLRPVSEQNGIVDTFSRLLRTLPRRVHIKITSERADLSPYIKDMYRHMESESNQRCRQQQVGTIKLMEAAGEMDGTSHRFFLSFAYEREGGLHKAPSFTEIKNRLNRDAFGIKTELSTCGNSIIYDGNSTEKTLEILYDLWCRGQREITPYAEHELAVTSRFSEKNPEEIIPVQNLISPNSIHFGESPNYIQVDNKYISYCYIPGRSYPTTQIGGWLQGLFNYIPGVDCDVWLKKIDIAKLQNKLRFWIKNNKTKVKSTDETDANYENVHNALQSGRFIKNALANGDDFFYFGVMLTIFADSLEELNVKFRMLRDHLIRLDLQLKHCTCKQTDAFRDSLPLIECDSNFWRKAMRNAPSSQLSSIYPFTAYEMMDEGGFFLGENISFGSPVCLNNFNTAKYQNANMLILGPSGSGKTYTLQTILLRMRQMGEQVFIVAPLKATEYRPACDAIGGTYIRLAHGSLQHINIMEIRPRVNVFESRKKDGSVLTNKIQKVRTFCSLLVPDMTPQEAQIVDAAIMRTYAKFGITNDNNSLWDPNKPGHYKKMPILSDLHGELKNAGEDAKRVYAVMSLYVTGSVDAFNHETDVNIDSQYVVFDVSDLSNEMLPLGMFVALDLITDAMESNSAIRKVVAIDEMWRLMCASKQSQEFLREIFKILRGLNGAAIGATQDLHEVTASEVGAAIINNTKIKILMQMDRREADAVAEVIDLTTTELEQLKRTGERRDKGRALFIANENHVFLRVVTSQIEHDLITTDAEDLARIEAERQSA